MSRTDESVSDSFDVASWFFENGLDIFIVMKNRILVRANPAWTALTGWTEAESVGRPIDDFGHPENTTAINAATRQTATYGFAETDVRVRAKDGRWLWMSCRIRLNQDGLIMAVLRDVTQEKQNQAEADKLSKSMELLRAAAGVHLWTFNPETGAYTIEADRTQDESGYGTETVGVAQMSDNIHPDDRAGFREVFFPALKTGEAGHHWYRYRRADGVYVHYHTAWRGVRQCANGKWEIQGLTQDVTELVAARDAALQGEQAARDAADAKAQFLANMSHEIRTPLNGVLGVLHLLKGEALSPDGRALLGEALNCGDMLAELLNDVLDFSKIEAGRLELERQPVDVPSVIEGVSAVLRPQIEAKGLYLRTEIDPEIGWVVSDPVRLRQVLFNLLGNAAKFTARGGVTLRLHGRGNGEGRRLRVEVADTGIGISAEARDRLFTRFHQADGSTTRRFGGTGLGLAITRALAELMDGEVGVESVEGEGSTFWIDIAAPEVAAPAPAAEAEQGWLEGLRILVVEDNATNRLIATRMLENLGAAVETAADGAVGLDAARRGGFDLIFMDVQMPVMDGLAATRAIRKLPPPVAATPIIAMTANAMSHQVREYLAAGMNGAVSKPLSPAAIVAEIARLSDDGAAAA